jgi:hypothetical protein
VRIRAAELISEQNRRADRVQDKTAVGTALRRDVFVKGGRLECAMGKSHIPGEQADRVEDKTAPTGSKSTPSVKSVANSFGREK